MCVCVCEREREREREGGGGKREREKNITREEGFRFLHFFRIDKWRCEGEGKKNEKDESRIVFVVIFRTK